MPYLVILPVACVLCLVFAPKIKKWLSAETTAVTTKVDAAASTVAADIKSKL